nr:ribonuclease H-like domain-containing protein [Tanacetum cinerariifolium]
GAGEHQTLKLKRNSSNKAEGKPLLFSSSTTNLVAYSDADWAGSPTTRRSISGYCVFLGNNLLSWSSKRQPMLSHSSADAKYHGIVNVVVETCWLRNLLCELHTPLSFDILVCCDNEFSMTDFGSLNYFLGISVTHGSSGMFLFQKKYDVEILEREHTDNCNSSQTPVDTESKLSTDGDPVCDPNLYRSLAGSL